MNNLRLLPFILLFLLSLSANATRIVRVCQSGGANRIFIDTSKQTCFTTYFIWARNGPFSSFAIIDSIKVRGMNTYNHAPAPGNTWEYFIETIDTCGPIFRFFTDTVMTDISPPSFTFLDSASANPITNKVHLGWHGNRTPDFDYYNVYSINAINELIVPFYRDTFLIDPKPTADPVLGPIKYDISAVDSCGNAHVFTLNPHTTIHLRYSLDTCERSVSLLWSPYIGWSGIRKYYIYQNIAGAGYLLLDSVNPSQTSYTQSIELGQQQQFFIRAFKDTTIAVGASSNSILFDTRSRNEPDASYLHKVSVLQPQQNQIELSIYNPNQEVTGYRIYGSNDFNSGYSVVSSFATNPNQTSFTQLLPFSQKYFYIEAINTCNDPFPSDETSRYMGLNATRNGFENTLAWETYFTWNTSVEKYRIYRGFSGSSGLIEFNLLDSVSGNDSSYIDKFPPVEQGERGVCYYVQAVQNSGDINPQITEANSIHFCITGQLKVFIPNAFRPEGANPVFRPEGSFIDYDLSSMEIYNRWGVKIFEKTGIRAGWNGNDFSNNYSRSGIYLYRIQIVSTNGTKQEFSGNVTLLD